jgi:hypothetical protein
MILFPKFAPDACCLEFSMLSAGGFVVSPSSMPLDGIENSA